MNHLEHCVVVVVSIPTPSSLSISQVSIVLAQSSKSPSYLHLDSAFKQQRLPAWQPVLTAGTVLPTFFIIGILFIPIGVGLLYFSDEVREVIIDYTMCKSSEIATDTCADRINNKVNKSCTCEIDFTLDRDFDGKVYMYYGLTNYYQNHRRYVKSRDDDQLLGKLSMNPSSDCHPFRVDANNVPIAPCGAIANSLFSGESNERLTIALEASQIDFDLLPVRHPDHPRCGGHEAHTRSGADVADRHRLVVGQEYKIQKSGRRPGNSP